MHFSKKPIRFNLALQGGGAHGAFTWGVLDRLLEEKRFQIGWISATSAGAVNAVALASGLAKGGPEGARAALSGIWEAVYKAGVPDLLRLNPFLYGLTRSPAVAQVASLWSPYDFNPLGFDPLRNLLTEAIDFDAIRAVSKPELLIAATEVTTGQARLFRRAQLTVDVVLASACLPTLHHAVAIDGIAYWDGGYSANPDLITLARESPVHDTLIVQVNPLAVRAVPTSVREIAGHVNRLTFNAPLQRDIEIIATARRLCRQSWRPWRRRADALASHRFHLVEAGRYTSTLSAETKMKPDWGLFTYLKEAGRTEGGKWLERHGSSIGRRETVDLAARYIGHDEAARVGLDSPASPEEPPPAVARSSSG